MFVEETQERERETEREKEREREREREREGGAIRGKTVMQLDDMTDREKNTTVRQRE